MTLLATEALVLRHVKQGDTSHVVTLLTRENGKIAVMAKGSRRPGSRFGAALDLLNYNDIQYRERAQGGLVFLNACELKRSFDNVRLDVFGYASASLCAELADRVLPEGAPAPEIFDLLLATLVILDETLPLPEGEGLRAVLLPLTFQIKLMDHLGIAPELTGCVGCGKADVNGPASLSARRGGLLCARCRAAEGGRRLGAETVAFLRTALYGELAEVMTAPHPPTKALILESRGALDAVLEYHHGKPPTLRSRKFLDELWQD
jgi:DNA repair protein RecO (recombination protein O)